MNITDLKIGTQLKIGFGIILFLILILGAVSWFQSNELAKQTEDLHDHPMKVRNALDELKIDILTIRLEYRNLLIAKDEETKHNSLSNSAIHKADAENNFQILSDLYLGPKSDINEAKTAFLKWHLLMETGMELVTEGRTTEAIGLLDVNQDMSKERELMLQTINNIDAYATGKAELFFSNAVELKRAMALQLAFLIATILAASFLIIIMLMKYINIPVAELTRVTRLYAKGKYDTRSSYNSSNEFGALSKSFNSLANTIQEEFVFKDRSAKFNGFLLKGLESQSVLSQVLEPLMQLTGSQVGAIYLLNDQKTHFDYFESIGLSSNFRKSYSVREFEGEFGIAMATGKISHIKDIPSETDLSFAAVSGIIRPKEIITIPLTDNKKVIAMISIATLHEYDAVALRLIHEMQGTITAWMNAMIANMKINKMSDSLKTQNIELEAQKRELSAQAGELVEQNVELEMQKKQLSESNQLKSSFLSNMSHELRTPLNSVIALSGVLNRRLQNHIPEEEYSYLNVIERNGKQLLGLINDILDLSRIEAGYEELNPVTFKADSLIREVVDLIGPQAKQKSIALSYSVIGEVPEITSDFEKCRHILQNLVANAIKFTDNGEVKIMAKADNNIILIEVKDTGIGIDNEFLPQIFDEFRQVDGSNARKYGGTGLGLSIARKYARLLEGDIFAESEYGIGSKFTLTLPLHANAKHMNAMTEETLYRSDQVKIPLHADKIVRGEQTILVVEDTEAIIVQLKDILISQGYNLMVAHNGKEALSQIAVQKPDAMILDLMMPEVDGFEVLKSIREKEETAHLPVLILTAKYITKEELAFLKTNSVHQLIQKGDINKNQLLNTISAMVFHEKKAVNLPDEKQISAEILQPASEKPIILIVEDNPDNMLTLKALLQDSCETIEASEGMNAIALALKYIPNLILMDYTLPGMNGTDTLQAIRNEPSLMPIPVIAVSANAMKGDREQFLASGFNDYISKPIDNEIFKQVIKKWTHKLN